MSDDRVQTHAIELVRRIGAAPAQVYRAFLDPRLLARWFGPADFRVLDVDVDARIGGRHLIRVASPHGITGVFDCRILEMIADEKLSLSWSWVVDNASAPPMTGSILTVKFLPLGSDATELRLRHERLGGAPDEDAEGIIDRWREALAKLQNISFEAR